MPITVPRASVTQAADDLKARDALLRGFPGSRVGHRQGRPSRHAHRSGAARHGRDVRQLPPEGTVAQARACGTTTPHGRLRRVLGRLEDEGYRRARSADDRDERRLIDASQKALERFDETMRELALLRYTEFERELGPLLTRFAVAETVRRMRDGRHPCVAGRDDDEHDRLDESGARADPDVRALAGRDARAWKTSRNSAATSRKRAGRSRRDRRRRAAAWNCRSSSSADRGRRRRRSLWRPSRQTFAGEVLASRRQRATEAVAASASSKINWELFDRGDGDVYLVRHGGGGQSGQGSRVAGRMRRSGDDAERFAAEAVNVAARTKTIDTAAFEPLLCAARRPGKAVSRIGSSSGRDRPGRRATWSTTRWAACCRCPAGATSSRSRSSTASTCSRPACAPTSASRCLAPTWTPSTASARTIEAALKPVNGARDVVAAPIMGKGYLQIDIDREKPARYGISRRGHSERDRSGPGRPGRHVHGREARPVSRCASAMPAPIARTRRAFGDCSSAPAAWRGANRPARRCLDAAAGRRCVRAIGARRPAKPRRAPPAHARDGHAADPAERRGRRPHRRRAGHDQERERPAA